MKRALQYLQLEDQQGRFSLTTLALLAGIGFLFFGIVSVFIAAAALYALKKLLNQSQILTAMEGAQEAALTQMQHEHEIAKTQETPLSGRIAALERKVHDLATPERLDALSRMGGGKKASG